MNAAALASFGFGMSSAAEAMRKLGESAAAVQLGLQEAYDQSGKLSYEEFQDMDKSKTALERAEALRGPANALRVFEGARPEPRARVGVGALSDRMLTPKQVNLIRYRFREKFGSEEGLLKALASKTGDAGFQNLESVPFAYMNLLVKLCGGPWEQGSGWKK